MTLWRTTRAAVLIVLVLLPACAVSGPGRPGPRDVLWRIVAECLDDAADWAETREYVAIRDVKMCGCSRMPGPDSRAGTRCGSSAWSFRVAADGGSPERELTQYVCR